MDTINIIMASQEYSTANHQNLWIELSEKLNGPTVIVNIPADHIITRLKNKKYRLSESYENMIKVSNKLFVFRPRFLLRPETLPQFLNGYTKSTLIKQLKKQFPQIKNYRVNLISYTGKWIDTFRSLENFKMYYYVMDEAQLLAHSDKKKLKSSKYDLIGCEYSEYVFTMSEEILNKRKIINDNIMVIGNGSSIASYDNKKVTRLEKSVAFVGNFREWIDLDLFEGLIKKREDLNFFILGPVQSNMISEFNRLLNSYQNLYYMGVSDKSSISNYYKKFDAIIVPYIQNDFMKATRPIKIVESIFSGTPVVTIPMSGYEENSFIRFANSTYEFSKELDYLFTHPINMDSIEYNRFLRENSWETLAMKIASKIV